MALVLDDHRGAVAEEALVDRQAGARAFDLPAFGLAAQLPRELAHLRNRLRGNGFAERGLRTCRPDYPLPRTVAAQWPLKNTVPPGQLLGRETTTTMRLPSTPALPRIR